MKEIISKVTVPPICFQLISKYSTYLLVALIESVIVLFQHVEKVT